MMHLVMRTTVTLDADVQSLLEREMKRKGLSFKEVLNQTLRRGLTRSGRTTYRPIGSYDLGVRPGVNLDKALRLASELEDEELLRKRELGK